MGVFGKDHHPHLPHRPHGGTPPTPPSSEPAGWYPDPTGRFSERLWDGSSWTTDVREGSDHMFDLDEIDLRIVELPPSTATPNAPRTIDRFILDETADQSTQ